MKNIIITISVIITIIAGLVWAGVTGQHQKESSQQTFATVKDDVAHGAKLYDVRTPEEFAAGHFEGAQNLPLQALQSGTLPDVSKDTTIYVYCHSGNRSGQSTRLLTQAGYTQVVDLRGLAAVEAIGGVLTTRGGAQ